MEQSKRNLIYDSYDNSGSSSSCAASNATSLMPFIGFVPASLTTDRTAKPLFPELPLLKRRKISHPTATSTMAVQLPTLFCDACQLQYHTTLLDHYRSITHQFSTQSSRPTFAIPTSNPGYRLLVREGWNENSGLGRDLQGNPKPATTVFKQTRRGVGGERLQAHVTHFSSQRDSGALTVAATSAVDYQARQEARLLGRHASQTTRIQYHSVYSDNPNADFDNRSGNEPAQILTTPSLKNLHPEPNPIDLRTSVVTSHQRRERRVEERLRTKRIAALENKIDRLVRTSLADLNSSH